MFCLYGQPLNASRTNSKLLFLIKAEEEEEEEEEVEVVVVVNLIICHSN